jgi:hypothetical protein
VCLAITVGPSFLPPPACQEKKVKLPLLAPLICAPNPPASPATLRELIQKHSEAGRKFAAGRNDSGMGTDRNGLLITPRSYSNWPADPTKRDLVADPATMQESQNVAKDRTHMTICRRTSTEVRIDRSMG